MKKQSAYLLILMCIAIYACEEIRSYPDEPEITSKSYSLTMSEDGLGNKAYLLEFSFDFVDGDGDLSCPESPFRGGDSNDTTTYSKLFWKYFVKVNGVYELFVSTDTALKDRYFLPWEDFMLREGQNKTLKGTITQKVRFYTHPFDTFKLEYYVKDKAYHQSNIIEIPEELVLQK
jgi:hypothetical protein